jgi:hypothetical protein
MVILEDTRNPVAITDYYKGTYSPLTLYSIERRKYPILYR